MAWTGQVVMQAMQWVQLPFHRGFPPAMVVFSSGQAVAHFPQWMQAEVVQNLCP
jgi:hypothetical protein